MNKDNRRSNSYYLIYKKLLLGIAIQLLAFLKLKRKQVKTNEVMPFATIRKELETAILSKSETQIYDIAYMWNLKYDTNELICKTETDSLT